MYSFETRIKALAVAGLMTASVAGSAVTAFADVATDKLLSEAPIVQKNIWYPSNGVVLPDNVTMTFTGTFSKSSLTDSTSRGTEGHEAPGALRATVKSEVTSNDENSAGYLKKEANWKVTAFGGDLDLDWTGVTPGVYEYTLTEVTEDAPAKDAYGLGWTYNVANTSYTLRVYVKADTSVEETSAEKRAVTYTLIDTQYETEGKDGKVTVDDGKKTETASFSNIYTARGGNNVTPPDGDNVTDENIPAALTIAKVANGAYDDQTKAFDFYISFTYPQVMGEYVTFDAKEGTTNKVLNDRDVRLEYRGADLSVADEDELSLGTYKFSLKNGEKIEFINLPAGTTYTVTEAAAEQYKVSDIKLIEDNIQDREIAKEGAVNTAFTPKENALVGVGENKVEFTNSHEDISFTGVVTHSAPFVVMIGALFAAVGGYVVLKKKVEE